jgi:tetratricopeptide (TPR) repeat protein
LRTTRAAVAALILACTLGACTALSLVSTGINVASRLAGHADDANVRKISELEAKNDWAGILQMAQGNLQRDSNNHDWWLIAGFANTQLGQHVQAIPCYQTAIRLSPDDIYTWNLLAQSFRIINEPERAIRTVEQALLIKSDSAMSYFLLGESYRDINLYERAVPNYTQAVGLDAGMADAWYGLGVSYARIGRRAEIAAIHERLLKLNPGLAAQLLQVSGNR